MSRQGTPLVDDRIYGIEFIRTQLLGLSKTAFYGRGGVYHDFPVITLSARRKGVYKSSVDRVLLARTRQPARAA